MSDAAGLDIAHIGTADGCRVSVNGQGHFPCSEHPASPPVEFPKAVADVLDTAFLEWVAAGTPAGEAVVHLNEFSKLGWNPPDPAASPVPAPVLSNRSAGPEEQQ